jgi:hypothetical protein
MITIAHRQGNTVAELTAALATDVDLVEADARMRYLAVSCHARWCAVDRWVTAFRNTATDSPAA